MAASAQIGVGGCCCVEGQRDGTTDFVFCLVGDPIPVLPPAAAPLPLFDLKSPPARPLAVSDGHAAVFLAHPEGFTAARTKALIEASKEAREKGKASTHCAQDCCVTDVPLPGVTLLALSRDQSVLAACTGSEIQFFSATSLLTDMDIKPSSSCSMGRFGTVKDFKWLDNAYIVLSNGGLLSHGSLGQGLKDIMENVDAVDCSKDGNHIAVARKNSLRILSPDLKETCCMALLFQLWPDSDSEGTDIKVDSIGWVRDDSIVVGCVRLNEESNEEGYLVQVIRSGGDTFFESSSKPVVFSYDIFRGIMNDILPSGVGPNLLLSYLHRWDLLVVTNKKSTEDHISLLKWPSRTDEERTVVYLKMAEDNYSPRIDLQENGDGNVLLGFGVENVSLFEKITILVGPEQKEVAPQHLLLCLASEGKLMIYYLARISDPSDLPQKSLSTIEGTNVNKQISPATASDKHPPSVISTSHDGKSLLAGHGTMATHDGSKAKKEKDPGESCRRLFSAVCEKLRDEREKYEAKPEKYKDELTTDSKDWTLIPIIEKRLNAPTDCAEPPAEYYRELTEELQAVTKRIIARKHAFERDDLVKTLRRLIREISQIDSADSFVDKKRKTEAVQACSWLDNRLKEQGSISIYKVPPSLTCKDIQNWINKLKQERKPKSLVKALDPEQIEVFCFNPCQDGALGNFVNHFSDRLSDHAQRQTYRHGEDSCRLLEIQKPNENPPRWMLVKVLDDGPPVEGVHPVVHYLRSDNCYLSAFSNSKGQIYELVEHDSMRMIEGSLPLGFDRDYPSLMNYERPNPLPKGVTAEDRMLEIVLNMEYFSRGIGALSRYDHNILADHNVSEDVKQEMVREMLEALARDAVILAEVSRIVTVFLSVNQNWKESHSTLTELLFKHMMLWRVYSVKVRTGAHNSKDDNIRRFTQEAFKLLNLVLNAKGPGAIENRSMAPGDDGKGDDDSGGDDVEQQTPESSRGRPAKDKKSKMSGSGSLDRSDDNLGGGHHGGTQKLNYDDCRPEITETSKVHMAFLTGLIVGKNFLQPMISQSLTKSGLELPIISRRNVQANGTGLGQVMSLAHETSSGPVAGSSIEDYMTSIPIPSTPIYTGETLFEIFSVETNLSLISTIVLYDDQGGTLVYESDEGHKEKFIRRRSKWLSKHTGKIAADFTDSLILRGPSRPMTAGADCWIFEINVPIESSFGLEDSEFSDTIFETTVCLDDDYMDSPRCSLMSIRGGFINLSSITFTNALRSTVRLGFDGPLNEEQFNLRGMLTLSIEGYDAKFTILKSRVLLYPVGQTKFEVPLLRHVLALPIGCRIHVKGNLMLGRQRLHVDKHLLLDRKTVEVEWPIVPSIKACICIEVSEFP
ncbi:uncharacterized protein LOC119360535 [Triticum dicoccoides]|uniref:uncharacterized protein LOC119360535 n=1 Tax=Triticum dicoccoides TaxID=85692 RepID=UPI0018905C07|nr:uncharacterized protein LOC119360535 [Triticum dicoccoides]